MVGSWKGLTGTNTLAYYEHSQIMPAKSFKTLGAGVNVIRLFKVLFTPLSVYFNIILTEVTPIKA